MSLEEDAVYRRLIDAMWVSQSPVGTMPMEDEKIATLARVTRRQWVKVKKQILKCFVDGGDGRWHQPDQKEIWETQCAKYENSVIRSIKAGRNSAASKAERRRLKVQPTVQPTVQPQVEPTVDDKFNLQTNPSPTGAPLVRGLSPREREGQAHGLAPGLPPSPEFQPPPKPLPVHPRIAARLAAKVAESAAVGVKNG